MARNIVRKHMEQNVKSYQGFAFAFCRIFRRSSKRTRVQGCPFENAVASFNERAIYLRVQ